MGVTVGCDPEFVLFDKETGKLISSRGIFPDGGINLRRRGVQDDHDPWDEEDENISVVHDGNASELRPKHSTKPSVVAKNLGSLIARWRKHTSHSLPSRYLIGVGSHCEIPPSQCLGGHIHIGSPPVTLTRPDRVDYRRDSAGPDGMTPAQKRLFVGTSFLWHLEDPKHMWHRRARESSYGGLFSNRGLPDYEHKTIEVRHPSSDWAAHPETMILALSLTAKIANTPKPQEVGEHRLLLTLAEEKYRQMMATTSNARDTMLKDYLDTVEDLLEEIVPASLIRGIKSWGRQLAKLRNDDGVVILDEKEWKV